VSAVRTIYLAQNTSNTALKWVYRKRLGESAATWQYEAFDPSAQTDTQIDAEGMSPWVSLADPLFMITPAQAQMSHPNGKNLKDAVRNNLAFYEPRLWLRLQR